MAVGEALPVRDALVAMTTAVRSGQMLVARGIGEQCVVPLSLTAGELAMAGKVSQGTESTVYRGFWQGRAVAIKKVRIATSADLDRFRSELTILASLSHDAVVLLLGARALPPDYMLVLPLAAAGNVRDALHERGWRPSWRQLLSMAAQVARGMAHVHARGVLHRDLKPANLLLLDDPTTTAAGGAAAAKEEGAGDGAAAMEADAQGSGRGEGLVRVQIADFGIAAREDEGGWAHGYDEEQSLANGKPSGGTRRRQVMGTLQYMAPELLLRTAPPSRASDVYAWAVTVNELATGTVPFSDCTKDNPEVHTVLEMGYGRQELAAAVCAEGLRPLLPRRCPRGFAALLGACWAKEPAARPTFEQVSEALGRLLADELPQWEAAEAAAAGGKGAQGTVVVDAMAVDDSDDPSAPTHPSAAATANGASAAGTDGPHHPPPPAGQPMWPFVLCPPADGTQPAPASAPLPEPPPGPALPAAALQPPACLALSTANGKGNGAHAHAPDANGSSNGGDGGTGGYSPCFNAGVFEAIGPRDSMEDYHVLCADLLGAPPHAPQAQHHAVAAEPPHHYHPEQQQQQQHPGGAVAVAAVFDGHRGGEAAEYCRRALLGQLRAALAAPGCGSPADALRRTFAALEEGYHAHWAAQRRAHAHLSRGPHAFPGTTAVVALLAPGGCLYVANAGDCRAVLCRGRRALAGSRDHTGLLEDERARLEGAGVRVTWQHGGWRVGATGLQVTRCVGDFDVKCGAAAPCASAPSVGVTAEPEVTAVRLAPDDHFLILGSDGLWDVVSVQEAAGLVYDTVKDPTMAAKRLVCEALMRGSADNVTAVVVFLTAVTTLERVYGAATGEAFAATGTAYGSRVRMAHDRHVVATADELRDTY